jgi:hypothetical protein
MYGIAHQLHKLYIEIVEGKTSKNFIRREL